MRIYLAGGHICGKYQQYKDYERMKIYLAGQNGLHSILEEQMILYLAGGVSGNLKPAWKMTKGATVDGFVKGLQDANF